MNSIKVRQLFDYDTWTYTYLLWCDQTKKCLLIDPVLEQVDRDLELIDKLGLKLEYILETHVHADHITGADTIRSKSKTKIVYGSRAGVNGADILLNDNEVLSFGNHTIKAIHTPGHTIGCTSYYINGFIFTGDTLFSLGCGKIFEGTYQEMFNSLSKLKSLPEDTKIYCGHEYTLQNSKFCIKHEPKNLNLQNKILRVNEKLKNNLPTIPSSLKDEIECNIFLRAKNVESFSKLRDLKDNF